MGFNLAFKGLTAYTESPPARTATRRHGAISQTTTSHTAMSRLPESHLPNYADSSPRTSTGLHRIASRKIIFLIITTFGISNLMCPSSCFALFFRTQLQKAVLPLVAGPENEVGNVSHAWQVARHMTQNNEKWRCCGLSRTELCMWRKQFWMT